jgi:carboxyl-terminal processing protease
LNRIIPPRRTWLYIVLGIGICSSFFAFRISDDYFQISRNLQIFADIYREANLKYVDNIKPGDFMKKGVDAMLASLDPYTEYIPESDLEDFKMKYVNPEYGGIGAIVYQKNDKIFISDVYEGFPAQKEDVRAGDEILKLNDIVVTPTNSREVGDMLKGQRGTDVVLEIKRPGIQQTLEKKISREEIHLKNVSYYGVVQPGIGYIKLDRFLENSASEVKQAFLELKDKEKINALILDLRGNGGGILQESVKIVNLFVAKGETIVTQRGRAQNSEFVYKATSSPIDTQIPLAVLVDKGTASASEIVSGSLQDLDRAIIVGQRSFGKGLVQQTLPLSYNTLMKITIAKYYTPSGRCIQALDYGHRNLDGTVNKISDSSIKSFKTHLGRMVYDGSGIYPDLSIKPKTYSNILYSLVNKQIIFDYSTNFRNTHPQISGPKDFKIDDAEYNRFVSYLSDKNYDYTSNSEKLLSDLKSSAEKENRYTEVEPEYLALKAKLTHKKAEDLIKYKPEIKKYLEMDIVGRYYYQTGRLQASLTDDPSIKESAKVLTSPDILASILNGSGKYHTIGNPGSIPDTAGLDSGDKKPSN